MHLPLSILKYTLLIVCLPCAAVAQGAAGAPSLALPYTWKSVKVGSGGTCTQVAVHPNAPEVVYMGADVGGVHRWDEASKQWICTADAFENKDVNLYHIEFIGLAPGDPDVVYYSAGKDWTNGTPDILKSTDRGRTWRKTEIRNSKGKPVYITNGFSAKRLAVHPLDSDLVFYGSRRDGLLRYSGGNWTTCADFPVPGQDPSGVNVEWIMFDPTDSKGGTLLAMVTPASAKDNVPKGIYRSKNGGQSWDIVPGSEYLKYATYDKNGVLIGVGGTKAWKFQNDSWTEITPAGNKRNLHSAAVSPGDANLIAVGGSSDNHAIYRSKDGGQSWDTFDREGIRKGTTSIAFDLPPWDTPTYYFTLTSLQFDLANPKKLFVTHWPGVAVCEDFTADIPRWRPQNAGHEEVCVFDMVSLPKGGLLISGLWDIGGLRHTSVSEMPAKQGRIGLFNETTSVDFCEKDPRFVTVCGGDKHGDGGGAGFSTDGGLSYRAFPAKPFPKARFGRIAVSPTDVRNIVWAPMGKSEKVFFTKDGGQTWKESKGAPSGISKDVMFTFFQPLCSDRVRSGVFYIYDHRDGRFFSSVDGGENWAVTARLPGQVGNHWDRHQIVCSPNKPGEIWASLDEKGLHRSQDGGATWQAIPSVKRSWAFDTDGKYLFVAGSTASDESGTAVYRSDDQGKTWLRTSGKEFGWGQGVTLAADRQNPGRVYFGTNGRGIFWGEPTEQN